MKTGVGILC